MPYFALIAYTINETDPSKSLRLRYWETLDTGLVALNSRFKNQDQKNVCVNAVFNVVNNITIVPDNPDFLSLVIDISKLKLELAWRTEDILVSEALQQRPSHQTKKRSHKCNNYL